MTAAFQPDAFQGDAFEVEAAGVTIGLLDRTAVAHAPTLSSFASVALALITQTASVFTPVTTTTSEEAAFQADAFQNDAFQTEEVIGDQFVVLDLLDASAALFNPTIVPDQFVVLGFINQQATAHAPSTLTTQTVTIALLSQTAAASAPALSLSVSIALINQTATPFGPTIASAQAVSIALLSQAASASAPTVSSSSAVSLGLISQGAAGFSPVVALTADWYISNPAVAFDPTLTDPSQSVALPRIGIVAFAFSPAVATADQDVVFERIERVAVASAPSLSGGNVVQSISFGLIDRTAATHDFSLTGPSTPAPPPGTPIRVLIDGEDMTHLVVWRLCELVTAVSGNASMGALIIRDVGQDRAEFVLGTRVVVDFGEDTRPIYSGYLLRAGRRFWFPVDYPDTLQRQWRLSVVDINVLFSRRIAYKKADPADITGPKYTVETYDDVALATLFEDWLDLSADDLDLVSEVRRVGYLNAGGQISYPWNGGMTMGEAVANIAQMPAAVWGINPSRQFVYADVDAENAPFVLTDRVEGVPGGGGGGGPTAWFRMSGIAIDGFVGGLLEDSFGRTEVGQWGTGDAGEWIEDGGTGDLSVDGEAVAESSGELQVEQYLFLPDDDGGIISASISWAATETIDEVFVALIKTGYFVRATWFANEGAPELKVDWFDGADLGESTIELPAYTPEQFVTLKIELDQSTGEATATYDDGSSYPVSSLVSLDNAPNGLRAYVFAHATEPEAEEEVAPVIPWANTAGYREATIWPDGSRLINDFLAWGAGKGSDHMVFHRRQSAESIAAHDLWQESFFSGAVWKQSTIEKVTNSAVNGSPQSRRGGKDDRYQIVCVTHENGLVVGDRVRFESVIWDYMDIIPVRKMTMTFPTHRDVRYELTLSHEIDRWGFEDPTPPPGPVDVPPIDVPPIVDPPPINCIPTDYPLDAWDRSASGSGPFASQVGFNAEELGGLWKRDPDRIEGPLEFPGTDVTLSGSTHLNRVSPILSSVAIPEVNEVVVNFDAHDPGPETFGTHGIISATTNHNRAVATGPFEPGSSVGANGYVYYFWGDSQPFNPDLTGSGSYSFLEPEMGHTGDVVGVSGGVAYIEVTDGHYGARIPSGASFATPTGGSWANQVSTGRFRIRFPSVPGSTGAGKLGIRYMTGTLYIEPGSGGTQLTLETGSGETVDTIGSWPSSSADFHTVEIAVDIPADEVTSRVYAPNGSLLSTITRAANGEGDTFDPDLAYHVWSTTGSPFRAEIGYLESTAYSDPAGTTSEAFSIDVPANNDGWGEGWTSYTTNTAVGPTPGVEWRVSGGYGIVELVDEGVYTGARIEREIEGGSADLSFSIRNYSLNNSDILTVYLGKATSGLTIRPFVTLGPTISMGHGTGSGSTAIGSSVLFDELEPVNVRIRWSTQGIKLWLWAEGSEEPAEAVLVLAKVVSLPVPLLWGYQPNFSSHTEGDEVWIGPIDSPTSGNTMNVVVTPEGLAYGTGVIDVTASVDAGVNLGRHRVWQTEDPEDGHAYAVGSGVWRADAWTTASTGTPDFKMSLVWGQYIAGDGLAGPGVVLDHQQVVADIRLPDLRINGVQPVFDMIVEGEIGIGFNGIAAAGSGEGDILAVVSTYAYADSGLPAPSYNDDFINGATARAYAFTTARTGREWFPFEFSVPRETAGNGVWGPDAGNRFHLQWGFHSEGSEDVVRAAGPFDGNGFLTVNQGGLDLDVRNVKYKVRLRPTLFGNLRPGPCPPPDIDIPSGVGQQVQSTTTREDDTLYRTVTPYADYSLVVFVDGKIKRWGVDFTETDPTEGTFTFSSPIPATAVVNAQFTTRVNT